MIRMLMIALTVVALATSCETIPWDKGAAEPTVGLEKTEQTDEIIVPDVPGPGIVPAAVRRFGDVPVPADAKEDLDRSYVFESDALQLGRLVYTSKHKVNELAQFYMDECADAGWKLDSVITASGAELRFSKPGKRLAVSIENMTLRPSRQIVLNLTPDRAG